MSLYDDSKAAGETAEREVIDNAVADLTAQIEQAKAERDAVQAEFDQHMEDEHPTEPPPPPPPPPPGDARFPGDPGVGKVLMGNNGEGDVKIAEFDSWTYGTAGRCSTIRVYNGTAMALGSGIRSDLVRYAQQGRIPMFSTKYGGMSPTAMSGGEADDTWRATAAWLADTYPGKMWYSPVGHEPEDNFPAGASADAYRRAFRRAVSVHMAHRPALVSKVAFCAPWLMEFTYDGSRDYRNWHPNWSGSEWLHDGPFDVLCSDGSVYRGSYIHMDAIDLYNPTTGPGSGARNQTWRNSIDAFKGDRVQRGQPPLPFNIGEYGIYDTPTTLDDNGVTLGDILMDTLDIGAAFDGLAGVAFWTNAQAQVTQNSPKMQAIRQWAQDARVVRA